MFYYVCLVLMLVMAAVDARAARELTGLKYKGYTKNWSGWKKNKAVDHDYKPFFKYGKYGLKKNKDRTMITSQYSSTGSMA
eukprot:jgi/Picre1/30013/NNA_005388.t1